MSEDAFQTRNYSQSTQIEHTSVLAQNAEIGEVETPGKAESGLDFATHQDLSGFL
jgi:hypothetical protein